MSQSQSSAVHQKYPPKEALPGLPLPACSFEYDQNPFCFFLAMKSIVDSLFYRVITAEEALRSMSQEMEELKKSGTNRLIHRDNSLTEEDNGG